MARVGNSESAVLKETASGQEQPITLSKEKAPPRMSLTKRRRYGDLVWALIFMFPALFFFVVFTFYPFVRSIWLSLNITDPTGTPAQFNGWNYYARILNLDGSGRTEYLRSIWTTIVFTLLVVPPGIAMAVGLAVLATARVRFMGVFRTIFTSSVAISVASGSVIWALIYNPSLKMTTWVLDLLNLKAQGVLLDSATALPAVALMTIWTGLGFNFIITLAGIQAIPTDYYEAGKIDGANASTSFRFITLPLLTPTLLFLFIISTIGCFQAFTQFNVLIGNEGPDGSTNVMVYALFQAFYKDNRYGFASALAVVLFLVLLILTIVQFKVLDKRVHYQ